MKDVVYAYIDSANKEYLSKLAMEYHTSISKVLNEVINQTRKLKKSLPLKDETPKYVKRAEKWKEKNTSVA